MPEVQPWEYSLYVPNDPRAVTVGRRTLRLILTVHGMTLRADVAELLATELITNAVRHTQGPAALRVRWAGGVLRIGAWDGDPQPPEAMPEPRNPALLEGGRGLAMVRACADGWGWQPLSRFGNRGKCVWCELGTGEPEAIRRAP
ncbi:MULTISPECIES: ATP-binding protein [unclassified Streptomyces]|uniref:ATP-binding protein n=1 Tax=unclassified Streptomyces TaxID=2593676 RepID=UPI00190572C6|nr:ATP-binding protein [Streptomyces sp. HSG2]